MFTYHHYSINDLKDFKDIIPFRRNAYSFTNL